MNSSLFRLVLILLLCIRCALPAAALDEDAYNTPVADKWALIVGVSKFTNEKLNLRWAAKDAEDFYQYLITKGQFAPDHVKLLTDEQATEKEIVSELGGKWLPHVAAPDDLVVIFISSHGSPAYMDTAGVNYILAHDSDPDDLYTTALEMQDLVEVVSKRIHAKRVILIVDACHSGALEVGGKGLSRNNFDVKELALGKGRVVLSSSLPEEVSWEMKDVHNSIFTRLLIDTLSNSPENLSLFDAYKTLKDSVQRTSLKERGVLQTPVLKSTWLGKPPILAITPTRQLPQKLPPTTIDTFKIPTTQVTPSTTTQVVPTASALPPQPPVTAPIELPPNIAIVPFVGPFVCRIQQLPPTTKVLWGKISSSAELANLAPKLSEAMFYALRSQFHDRAMGPRLTNMSLSNMGNLARTDQVDTRSWTPDDWKKLGKSLQAKYIVTGWIDAADWATGMMANKYTTYVSTKVISGDTGQELIFIDRLKVNKSPTNGDMLGGVKYYENTMMPACAKAIVKQLQTTLKSDQSK
ncbi:MAG: caspase family protein [Cyanobacteria bacterium SZAS-4]|nr:caspase family protein [Cyanobacteria bacterium SZAS-4]